MYNMYGVLEGVLSNLAWALIGVGLTYAYRLFFKILPTKRLWQLKNHNSLVICTATSTKMDKSEHHTPATGIGQVRALALIISSLNRAYKKVKIKNVLLSEDQLHAQIENDIILLGGPKHNKITEKFLKKIENLSIVNQVDNLIAWGISPDKKEFIPIIDNKKIIRDYGLIIRMKNPFSSSENTILLFSGCHTYGTIAAARYFTENLYKEAIKGKKINQNIAAIVSCEVQDGWPISIHLMKKHIF